MKIRPFHRRSRLEFLQRPGPVLRALLLGCSLTAGALTPASAQRLVEFLAVNTSGLKDEDGTYQPWIEIWNQNQTSVLTLSGYKLTIGGTPWSIPTIQLMPDERIIIWASGKNKTAPTAPLHTNFVLPATAGTTLSLLNSSNTVVSSFASYPAQTADVSWGRDEVDTAAVPTLVGSYTTPTPMEKNATYSGAGVAGGVIFSESSRAFNLTNEDATISLTLSQAAPDPQAEIRYTTSFSNMGVARQQHTATVVSDGRVITAGGISSSTLATSEAFFPAATTWVAAGNLSGARRLHTATLLGNGKILIAGGLSTTALATAQTFDPSTSTWTNAGSLATPRQLHTATLLNDGRVLVAGGRAASPASPVNTVEIYNPATDTWTAGASMAEAREKHTATLLPDGKVLVAGGASPTVLNTAEIYDPAANTWTAAASMTGVRQEHTATLLANGRIFVVGGYATAAVATTELYDPSSNTWSTGPSITSARRLHTATVLPDNRVLVAGGQGTSSLNSVQIYNPETNSWTAGAAMTTARHYHTATLLGDGRVLIAGGSLSSTSQPTSEIYTPSLNTWIASPRQPDLPGPGSPVYTGPLLISTTQMVRARIFKPGLLPGATDTHCYLKLETNARNFSSTMPVVVITTFGVVPPADGDQPAFMWVWEPAPGGTVKFSDPPVIASRTVTDRRGSSTLENAKYNLNIETRNAYDEDERDVMLLGMPEHSDWVFHAPYKFDPALLRNPVMYALSNAIGRYAVRTRMAEVFVDVNSGGLNLTTANSAANDYFGVYNVMEKIRRNADRVDIKKLETYDNTDPARTGGYIFKVDRGDPGDNGLSIGGQSELEYYYPKERDLLSPQRLPQRQFFTSYLTAFTTRLNGANWKSPTEGYRTHLDTQSAIDHHLLNVWAFNVDALRLSCYWHKEREGKLQLGPIWDFDRTLSSTDGRDANPAVWRSQSGDFGTDFFNYTWWNRLFADSEFYQEYIDRWQELRAGPLSRENTEAIIDSLNAGISTQAVGRDSARWMGDVSKRSWTRPFSPGGTLPAGQAAEVQRLKDYMQQRANFMDTQWVARVTASVPAGFITPGTSVTLSGPAGVPIYYTLDGSDPRPSGGAAPGAGPLLYSGPIVINTSTRLRARAYKANHTALTGTNNPPLVSKWGGQWDATYNTDSPAMPGDLILSEINYHPSDPTAAELTASPGLTDNDFEFLEIRNISGRSINLAGCEITEGVTYSFAGTAARSLGPGESLVIVSNPAGFGVRYGNTLVVSGPWAGNLSNSGERLTMLNAGGATLFSITYMDTWFPETDGPGSTLVASQFYPQDPNLQSAWLSSNAANGSPGGWDAASLPVSAGPDAAGGASETLTLRGEIAGATAPGTPVLAWTQVSGSGTLSFGTPATAVTTVTASVPGSYRARLTLTVNGVTTFDEVDIRFADTLAAWVARNPEIGSLTDDPDRDGRSNLLEFALMTSPTVPDGNAPPELAVINGRTTLTYPRRKPASGVTYSVEVSDNGLNAFRTPNSGELAEVVMADDGVVETIRITDTATPGTPPLRFLRLRVTAAP